MLPHNMNAGVITFSFNRQVSYAVLVVPIGVSGPRHSEIVGTAWW